MTVPTIDSNSIAECPAPEPGCSTVTAGSTETQTEEAEQRPVKAGEAPIKKEFLAKVTPAAATAAPITEPCTEPSTAPAKATGGQNANRRAQNKNKAYQVSTSDRLCAKLSLGEDCPFGDKCTFSHDIAKYLAEKPVDLGTQCVLFDTYGACKYGLRCRYAGAHTDAEHKQMRVEGKQQLYAHNDFGREIQIRMRKKQITFPRTDAFDRTCAASSSDETPITDQEPKRQKTAGRVDFRGKTYLAPLTTVGNLPFRRICKGFGVDITCSEMALAGNLLQGQQSEWALLKRHPSETLFGIQLAGNRADQLGRAAEAVGNECLVDFIDLNMGCPIDMAYNSGGGSALMAQSAKVERIVRTMRAVVDCDITVKLRTGISATTPAAHTFVPQFERWGAALTTVHGRSRQQRYTKHADWGYIGECKQRAAQMPVFGGGDVLSWEDYWAHLEDEKQCDGVMIGRGALIKPWVFKEIEERRVWDISATERLDMLREFARFGMEHWGTDTQGMDNVRRYLLEWQSFLYRYIPAGILEVLPQKMNQRPPAFIGRNDLETLMGSEKSRDWIKISEMILGPVSDDFTFVPKHKSNSYE